MKKPKQQPQRTAEDAAKLWGLPILGEWTQCRQLADDHWQGVNGTGAIMDVRGGPLRGCILVIEGSIVHGVIRLTPAAA